jgi:hypothetical protein
MPGQSNVFVIGNFKFNLFDIFNGLSSTHIAIHLFKNITDKEIEMSPELLEYFGKNLIHLPSNLNIQSLIPYADIDDLELVKMFKRLV